MHGRLPVGAGQGAALIVAGKVTNLKDGAQMAAESIDSGAARGKLWALKRAMS